MSFLNKQLLLLGEAHKLSMQELHHAGADNTKVWRKGSAYLCVCEPLRRLTEVKKGTLIGFVGCRGKLSHRSLFGFAAR